MHERINIYACILGWKSEKGDRLREQVVGRRVSVWNGSQRNTM
jgi:hypothetical protein